jgi:6-phosphogluconolactonase (cycloisomerase 2 family)
MPMPMPMSNHFPNASAENRALSSAGVRYTSARIAVVAALWGLAVAAPHTASAQSAATTGFVYVESNNPNGNAIFAYRRHGDGSLAPLPGSPFSTGGLGINSTFALGPFDSDQEVIINKKKSLLFAVNGGSDTIAVFNINANGSLTPVNGSPFPSGGSNPVSVGLSGDDVLCVVNQDQNPGQPGRFLPNYTSFRVSNHGRLTPIPRSTFFSDAGSSPSQALISPDGGVLFGADFLGGLLRTFRIADNGALALGVSLPLPPGEFAHTGAPPNPLGLAVHPTKRLLYVDFVTINRIGVYRYANDGRLKFLRSVPDSGKAPCWALVNKAGTRLYVSNTADSSISVYDIEIDPTEPFEIQKVALRTTGSCFQFALDSSETFLHVVTQQAAPTQDASANALNVLKVAEDGTLTEVPSSPTHFPVPNLVRPQGVAAL